MKILSSNNKNFMLIDDFLSKERKNFNQKMFLQNQKLIKDVKRNGDKALEIWKGEI